jgi:hypothetical protein
MKESFYIDRTRTPFEIRDENGLAVAVLAMRDTLDTVSAAEDLDRVADWIESEDPSVRIRFSDGGIEVEAFCEPEGTHKPPQV